MIPATKEGECSTHFHNLVGHQHVLCQPLEPASSTILNLSMGLIIMMHHTNQLHQGASKYYDLKLYYCLPFKYKLSGATWTQYFLSECQQSLGEKRAVSLLSAIKVPGTISGSI
jgi:hypothetical protein